MDTNESFLMLVGHINSTSPTALTTWSGSPTALTTCSGSPTALTTWSGFWCRTSEIFDSCNVFFLFLSWARQGEILIIFVGHICSILSVCMDSQTSPEIQINLFSFDKICVLLQLPFSEDNKNQWVIYLPCLISYLTIILTTQSLVVITRLQNEIM